MPPETFPPEHFVKLLMRDDGVLDALEEDSVKRGINIVGPSVGSLLYVLSKAIGARRILELGTANGYSTIWLARALPETGKLVSLEWEEKWAKEARGNLRKAGVEERVEVIVGDVRKVLPDLVDPYDLIFNDIEKEMYTDTLPDCVRLLKPRGLLIHDNVAFTTVGDFNEQLKEYPKIPRGIVFSSRMYSELPEQRLQFIPLYHAYSATGSSRAV